METGRSTPHQIQGSHAAVAVSQDSRVVSTRPAMDLGPAYIRAEQAQHHIHLVNAVKKDAAPFRLDVAGASGNQSLNGAELAHLFGKGPVRSLFGQRRKRTDRHAQLRSPRQKALSLGLAVAKRLVNKKRDLSLQQRPGRWQMLLAVAVIDHRPIDLANQLFRRADDVRDLTGGSGSLRILSGLAPHVGHAHSPHPFFDVEYLGDGSRVAVFRPDDADVQHLMPPQTATASTPSCPAPTPDPPAR